MKKRIIALLISLGIVSLTACSSNSEANIVEEKTVLQQIEEAETYDEITSFLSEELGTEEQEALEAKVIEYICNNMNGFYYHIYELYETFYDDYKAVYVNGQEAIYFVPMTEEGLEELGMSLEELPDLDDSELYKYNIVGAEVTEVSDERKMVMTLSSAFINGTAEDDRWNETRLYLSEDKFSIDGYFADETTEIGKYTADNYLYPTVLYKSFFSSIEDAESFAVAQKKAWDKWEAEKEANKNKEPEIGMTESEVVNGAWGYPDKKNIDEYESGTKEQWVYDGKGYVYFEDGIVTSIQHRD